MNSDPSATGLIDSHCHLNYLHTGDELDKIAAVIDRAKSNNVTHCLCISVDLARIPEVLHIAQSFDNVKASVGVHPCDVMQTPADTMQQLKVFVKHEQVIAIGETGLDYYHEQNLNKTLQKKYFTEQIHLSIATDKPLIVHTRAARDDTIDILKTEGADKARGVMHCFTETLDMAKKALDLGFYISFSGIITFKNADSIRDVCQYAPMDRILVETDAPYLAPVPFRGKTNEPAHVLYVAKQLAAIKGLSLEEVAQLTTENVQRLFSWPC